MGPGGGGVLSCVIHGNSTHAPKAGAAYSWKRSGRWSSSPSAPASSPCSNAPVPSSSRSVFCLLSSLVVVVDGGHRTSEMSTLGRKKQRPERKKNRTTGEAIKGLRMLHVHMHVRACNEMNSASHRTPPAPTSRARSLRKRQRVLPTPNGTFLFQELQTKIFPYDALFGAESSSCLRSDPSFQNWFNGCCATTRIFTVRWTGQR